MSLSAASSLLGLSFFSRVLTFGMNTALARGLGPQWYGLACVQLQLLTSTALFLAQEGIRRACQRIYPGGDEPALLTHTVNLAWMSVPITLLTALALGWYSTTHKLEEDASALVPHAERSIAVWMVCSAAVVEACAEPGWVYAQQNMRTPMRVAAEGSALVVRVLATYFLTLVRQHGAIGFGVAQLAYAVVYVTLLYGMLFRSCAPLLWPRRAPPSGDSRWLSPRGRTLGLQYSAQSIQKYVLTEGERVVLIAVSPLAQQGAFALVSNLGSLVARLLLAPMEEVAFASFSRRAAAGSLDRVAFLQLYAMLRAAAIFGGVFVSFGPSYSWLLLHILYGDKWSTTEAPSALAMYCWLVCAMGLNGISEAFVNATAKDAQLRRLWCVAAPLFRTVLPLILSYSSRIRTLLCTSSYAESFLACRWAMGALSLMYIPLAAFALLRFGSVGLVLANVVNLASRHTYYVLCIRAASRAHFAVGAEASPQLLPHKAVMLSLVISAAITRFSNWNVEKQESIAAQCGHVGLGVVCLIVVGSCAWRYESELVEQLTALRKARKMN